MFTAKTQTELDLSAVGGAGRRSPVHTVVIDLPRRPPWLPLIVALWILAAVMGLALGVALTPASGASGGPHQVLVLIGVLGAAAFSLAVALTVVRVRLRSRGRARRTLSRAQFGAQASDAELASAVARMARCNAEDARRLRRRHISVWEGRLGRPLPRMWIAGREAAAGLTVWRTAEEGRAAGEPEEPREYAAVVRSHVWDGPLAILMVFGAIAMTTGIGALLSALSPSGWMGGAVGTFLGSLLLTAAIAVLLIVWTFVRGQRGWWLVIGDGKARLVRRSRAGVERAAHAIDPRAAVVVVTPAGERVKEWNRDDAPAPFIWRFVPPAPAPAFDVLEFDPRGTPWERSVNLNLHSAEELGFGPRIG